MKRDGVPDAARERALRGLALLGALVLLVSVFRHLARALEAL